MKTVNKQNSASSEIFMETLPEYLIAAREHFSYTVKQVARITNISEKFIADLERGYYHKLPPDVYIKGFLRKLAELYRVDQELLLFQYKKENAVQGSKRERHKARQQPVMGLKTLTASRFIITPRTIMLTAVGFFIIMILGYLSYQVHAINKPPVIQVFEPLDNVVVHSSSVLVSGQTEPGASLSINDQEVDIDSSGKFKKLISVGPGQKILNFVAKNAFGKIGTRQISIIADYQAQPEQNKPRQLSLVVKADAHHAIIRIKIDDQLELEENFAPGDIKTYTAKNNVTIGTSNAGSTSVILNGKDLGKLGRNGEKLDNIIFNAELLGDGR